VEGPPQPVTLVAIRKALSKMKCGKVAGPSGIIAEIMTDRQTDRRKDRGTDGQGDSSISHLN